MSRVIKTIILLTLIIITDLFFNFGIVTFTSPSGKEFKMSLILFFLMIFLVLSFSAYFYKKRYRNFAEKKNDILLKYLYQIEKIFTSQEYDKLHQIIYNLEQEKYDPYLLFLCKFYTQVVCNHNINLKQESLSIYKEKPDSLTVLKSLIILNKELIEEKIYYIKQFAKNAPDSPWILHILFDYYRNNNQTRNAQNCYNRIKLSSYFSSKEKQEYYIYVCLLKVKTSYFEKRQWYYLKEAYKVNHLFHLSLKSIFDFTIKKSINKRVQYFYQLWALSSSIELAKVILNSLDKEDGLILILNEFKSFDKTEDIIFLFGSIYLLLKNWDDAYLLLFDDNILSKEIINLRVDYYVNKDKDYEKAFNILNLNNIYGEKCK